MDVSKIIYDENAGKHVLMAHTLRLFPELGEIPVRFFSELVLWPRPLPPFDTIDHCPPTITTDPHAFTITLAPRTT